MEEKELSCAGEAAAEESVELGAEMGAARDGVRRRLLNDQAIDTGCGLKAFRREAYLALPYFDHQHRYLPALMIREGYGVRFEPVGHRPRQSGRSKYTNLGRLGVAVFDLAGVIWLNARARRHGGVFEAPLHEDAEQA